MKKNKQLSLREFIWLGFNYLVGIGFVGNFAILSNVNRLNSIGANVVWIFLIIGFVAGNCAWAFAKMAKIHNSNNNGAAYIYVRTNFGRFCGWLVGFMQYVSLPFVITIQILFLIRGTFSAEFTSSSGHQWYTANWGDFSDLYLDLIGITIYLLASSAIFVGIKLYKRMAHTTSIIRWATASFLVIAAIALAINNGSSNADYWSKNSPLTFPGFMQTFTSCFFFFAGFEIFATAGKNVVNPEKNIGKGITLIILISTIFYIIVSTIFFLAFKTFEQNMIMGTWNSFSSKLILYGGPVLMIVSGLVAKINISMQNAFYGGTALQPLSKEGYISDKLFEINKDGIPEKSIILNLLITIIMIILWLIIPDLIKGIWLHNNPGKPYASAFNVSTVSMASSTISIFVYIMVICTTLKVAINKKLKLNFYEKVVFPIVLLFLLLILFWHYYALIDNAISDLNKPNATSASLVAMLVEIIFIFLSFGFATMWYFAYYYPKYKKRLVFSSELQKSLDSEFNFNQEHQDYLEKLYQEI